MMKKLLARRLVIICVMTLGSAVMAPGCSGAAGDVCEAMCDCLLCNDREEDACLIETGKWFEFADVYGCEQEADRLSECLTSRADCVRGAFDQSDCAEDQADFNKCLDDGSRAFPGGGLGQPQPQPQPGAPNQG